MAVQQPGIGGDKFTAAEHNGALLLFFPSSFRSDIPTQHGTADAVEARVVNLDTGQVMENTMIFGRALVGQLKGAAGTGDEVLGRLGQGQNTKGNPPWMLFSYSEQDYAKYEAWLKANPQGPQQPAPPTPSASAPQATGGWQPQGGPAPAATPAWNQPAPAAPQAQWNAPAAAPAPAAWTPPAPAPVQLDPQLEAFLRSKGVDPAQFPNQEAAVAYANMIAAQ
jgi:hypothetical protein